MLKDIKRIINNFNHLFHNNYDSFKANNYNYRYDMSNRVNRMDLFVSLLLEGEE